MDSYLSNENLKHNFTCENKSNICKILDWGPDVAFFSVPEDKGPDEIDHDVIIPVAKSKLPEFVLTIGRAKD